MSIPLTMTTLSSLDLVRQSSPLTGQYGYYHAEICDEALIVTGWALVPAEGGHRLPERLLVTAGEHILGYGPPLLPRPDVVAAKEGQTPLNNGFTLHLAKYAGSLAAVRVWALDHNRQLPLLPQARFENLSADYINNLDDDLRQLYFVDTMRAEDIPYHALGSCARVYSDIQYADAKNQQCHIIGWVLIENGRGEYTLPQQVFCIVDQNLVFQGICNTHRYDVQTFCAGAPSFSGLDFFCLKPETSLSIVVKDSESRLYFCKAPRIAA